MSGTDLRLNGSTSEGPDPAAAQVIFYFAGKETLFPVCKDDFLVPDIQFPDVAHRVHKLYRKKLPGQASLCTSSQSIHVLFPFSIFFALT